MDFTLSSACSARLKSRCSMNACAMISDVLRVVQQHIKYAASATHIRSDAHLLSNLL
jgi:hypothetical protein